MLPTELRTDIEKELETLIGKRTTIKNSTLVAGGCINKAARLETNAGIFFIKWNDTLAFPNMFEAESEGLKLLHQSKCIRIPEVKIQARSGKHSFLILEFIIGGARSKQFWKEFGEKLSCLHQNKSDKFGWKINNFIGSLPQLNDWCESWNDFFIENRLRKQMKIAYDAGSLDENDLRLADLMFLQLDNIIPDEQPALLHGDLWSGNFLTDEFGMPCLVDPAVYYGHREVDLAMSYLFGGFESEFYNAYNASFKLEKGFAERIDIYNLYPLLVHLNLFGLSYRATIRSILRKFT